jgi:hypothetical protein
MRLGATILGQVRIQSESVIQLPGTALTQSEGKPAVWIVDPEKKTVSLLPVTMGRYDTSSIIVVDGLKDGALVVTAGVQVLRPGRLLEPPAAFRSEPQLQYFGMGSGAPLIRLVFGHHHRCGGRTVLFETGP